MTPKTFPRLAVLVALAFSHTAMAQPAKPLAAAFESSPAAYNVTFDLPAEVREKYKAMFQTTKVQGTLRNRMAVSIEGRRIRVRLSNELGREPLRIGGASIALAGEGVAAKPGSLRQLTFGGKAGITIPAGAPVLSDPVDLDVAANAELVASVFVEQEVDASPLAGIVMLRSDGNAVMQETLANASPVAGRPIVTGILVEPRKVGPVIVALGDSITDAGRQKPDVPHGWVATLATRLSAARTGASAVSAGIGGNRVLRDGWGPSALARADRDVFSVPGVTHVILLEGINDIGMSGKTMTGSEPPLDLEAMLQAYSQIAARAHARGLKIYIGTLLPFRGAPYFTEEKEQIRLAVNAWIRSNKEFDGVIDFEAATRDPAHPDRLQAAYDSGDHLHPSAAGYRAMGEAIPLALFR